MPTYPNWFINDQPETLKAQTEKQTPPGAYLQAELRFPTTWRRHQLGQPPQRETTSEQRVQPATKDDHVTGRGAGSAGGQRGSPAGPLQHSGGLRGGEVGLSSQLVRG